MELKDMPDYTLWYPCAFFCCCDLPYDALDDASVFEPSKLGFVAPERTELFRFDSSVIYFGCCWPMINESEGVLWVERKT